MQCFLEYNSEVSEGLKATASVVPQHWQPNSGLVMTNDVSGVNLEEAVPCIALSKNDSYVMSATGGKVSLFNMMTFKVFLHMHVLHISLTLKYCIVLEFALFVGYDYIHATSPYFYLPSIPSSR